MKTIFLLFSLALAGFRSIRITSSGPKVLFSTNVQIDQTRNEKLEILAFEEPADVIARFIRDKNLPMTAEKQLLGEVCKAISCKREYSDVLIMNSPISWFSEVNNEYCSVVLRMGETDLENMTEYVSHHCEVLKNIFPACFCTEILMNEIYKQIEQNAAAFIWSEYSSPHTRLGVKKNATEREIKKAYRSLSRNLHPDALKKEGHEDDGNLETKFMLLTEAYEKMLQNLKNKGQPVHFDNSDVIQFSDSTDDDTVTVSVAGFTIHMKTGFKAVKDEFGNIQFENV